MQTTGVDETAAGPRRAHDGFEQPVAVLRTLLVGALLVLPACGGGGGGGGSSGVVSPPVPSITGTGSAPGSGPGDTLGYFPLQSGNQWLFNAANSDPKALAPMGDAQVSVSGTKSVLGTTATVLTHLNSTVSMSAIDQYYASSLGGITFLGNTDPIDTISPLIVPYVQLLFPVQTGTVSSIVGTNLAYGKDAAGNSITLDLTQTIVNAGIEAANVPAGSFPNALKQTTTVKATAKNGTQSVLVTGTDTTWMVPGVGVVKESSQVNSGGTSLTQTFDLKGYVVNGMHHGLVNVRPLPPLSDAVYGGVMAVASDGTNFLVVTRQFPSAVGTSLQEWIGTLIGPDGTVLSTFNIDAANAVAGTGTPGAAAASFDGTNYLVVYTQDHASTVQPTTLDAVRISPAGAVLGSGVSVAVLPNSEPTRYVTLAFDGSQYLLVYLLTGASNGLALWGQFLSPTSGQPTGAAFAIAPSATPLANPTLGFDGTNFLLVWDDWNRGGTESVLALRLSPTGAPLDTNPVALLSVSGMQSGDVRETLPAIAFDGTNYLVAYRDFRPVFTGASPMAQISAARVSPSGVLLDGTAGSPGIAIASAMGGAGMSGTLSAASLGGQFHVVWDDAQNGQVYGARVSAGGAVTSSGTSGFLLVNRSYQVQSTFAVAPLLIVASQSGLLCWNSAAGPPGGVSVALVYPPGP